MTDFVLIRPLPFRDPDRLVKLFERTSGYGRMELSAANDRDWKQGATVFESIGSSRERPAVVPSCRDPSRRFGSSATAFAEAIAVRLSAPQVW